MTAEELGWGITVEAKLVVEAELKAPGKNWQWNWECSVSLMRTAKPFRETITPLTRAETLSMKAMMSLARIARLLTEALSFQVLGFLR